MQQILQQYVAHFCAPPPQPLLLLSLAAVVGNLEAIQHHTADTTMWPSAEYLDVPGPGKPKGLFWCPIRTAASAGHVDILKHLLSILDPLMPIYWESRQYWNNGWKAVIYRIHGAIDAAIQSKRVEVLIELLGFAMWHGSYADDCPCCWGVAKDCAVSWIKHAAKSGDVELSRLLYGRSLRWVASGCATMTCYSRRLASMARPRLSVISSTAN
jgi:hypothetical protein